MKPIILKPHELKAAIEGRLTRIVRVMKEHPCWEESPTLCEDGIMRGRYRYISQSNDCEVDVWESKPPFSPGETVFVKEAFAYCMLRRDITDEYHSVSIPLSRYKRDCKALNSYHVAYKSDEQPGDEPLEGEGWKYSRSMPLWASRYHITIKGVEAKQAKDLTNAEIRGNCIKPDIVDSGGQNPDGSWIDVADYVHPFLMAYNVEPYTWLWLWKVEVKKV
jgi:hypothetical protein